MLCKVRYAAFAVGLALCVLDGVTGTTVAQPSRPPDTQRGREIAERLCSGCHRVTPEQALPGGWADVPSFAEIANRPGRTAERLVGSIMIPHPPMPDIALATGTLHDVAAYILTFKKD